MGDISSLGTCNNETLKKEKTQKRKKKCLQILCNWNIKHLSILAFLDLYRKEEDLVFVFVEALRVIRPNLL